MTTSPQLRESPETTKFQALLGPTSILLGGVTGATAFFGEHKQVHPRLTTKIEVRKIEAKVFAANGFIPHS
jgi:hypothetical protein